MSMAVAFLAIVYSADLDGTSRGARAKIVLTPNSTKLLQRDVLLVRAQLLNPSTEELEVKPLTEEPRGYYFSIQIFSDRKWHTLPSMQERHFGNGCGGTGPKQIGAKSSLAEYNWFQQDRDDYVFGNPGKYELRAIAQTSRCELASHPVVIHVGERSAVNLKRVQDVNDQLVNIQMTLRWD